MSKVETWNLNDMFAIEHTTGKGGTAACRRSRRRAAPIFTWPP